jgi:hypothetical protein
MIFALFHIAAFVFTITLDKDSSFLMSMFKWVPWFKWITLFGLILFCIDVIWYLVAMNDAQREKAALAHEVNTLKAKLFDLQEELSKKSAAQPPTNPPSKV